MQLARRRDDDSLVASMNALRRFEAEREARSQIDDDYARQQQLQVEMERWRHEQAARIDEVQRATLAEAELNEAERRRFEAEVFAAVVATAPKQRVWLRVSTLFVLFVFAAAAGAAYALQTQENEESAAELRAAIVAQRQATASESAARAELAQSRRDLATARDVLANAARMADSQPWVTPADAVPAPVAGVVPLPSAPVVAPAAPATLHPAAPVATSVPVTTPLTPEPAPTVAPPATPVPAAAAPALDDAAKKHVSHSSSRHARHADQAKADEPAPALRPGKPAKLDICPPNQPICR